MKAIPLWITFSLVCAGVCLYPRPLPAQAAAQSQPARQGAVSPGVWSAPPAGQAQQSSAFQSACGNQPMCYDAPSFAVALVDFRMSTSRGSKVMDATLRFVNKTNQPLTLGYVDGSGIAIDDQGNRYGTYNNVGLAGIGLVNGANGDPKFVLQPSSAGDARFELFWRPGAQDPIGSTFELDMNIREINTLVGGQHTLGGEVPLRFQGITNGMTGAGLASSTGSAAGAAGNPGTADFVGTSGVANNVVAGASAQAPCDANGSLNSVMNTANSIGGQTTANATSNATAAIANFKSMFGKKKAAQTLAANSTAAPCASAATVAPATQQNVVAPAIASAAPVPNTVAAQNAAHASSVVPVNGAKLVPVATTAAKPAAKPPAQPVATVAPKTLPPQKPPANAKKTTSASTQQKTDTSH